MCLNNVLFLVSDKLVLVSYNLLGVDNASNHMDLYYNILPQHLDWSRRKHLICKEISRYNATILCLQASSDLYYCILHCNVSLLFNVLLWLVRCILHMSWLNIKTIVPYVMVSLIIGGFVSLSKMASFFLLIYIEAGERPRDLHFDDEFI